MDFSARWKQLLSENTDIEGGVFLTTNGVPISWSKFAEQDHEIVVRHCAAVAAIAHQLTVDSERSEFEALVLEGKQGYLVLMPVMDKANLAILVRKQARLGLVLLDIRRAIDDTFGPGLAVEPIFPPRSPKRGTAFARPDDD